MASRSFLTFKEADCFAREVLKTQKHGIRIARSYDKFVVEGIILVDNQTSAHSSTKQTTPPYGGHWHDDASAKRAGLAKLDRCISEEDAL